MTSQPTTSLLPAGALKPTLAPHCNLRGCTTIIPLKLCKGCNLVKYCSKSHQAADWDDHKKHCVTFRSGQERRAGMEATLARNVQNPFDCAVGYFSQSIFTRDYLNHRGSQVDHLLQQFNTIDAVELALSNLKDMMALCRFDHGFYRDWVGPILLRLGRFQEAYDFTKFWATSGSSSSFWSQDEKILVANDKRESPNWDRKALLPCFVKRNYDVCESIDWILDPPLSDEDYLPPKVSIFYALVVIIVKITTYLGLAPCLERMDALRAGKRVPREIYDHIQNVLIQSSVGSVWQHNVPAKHHAIRQQLLCQIDKLFDFIHCRNGVFWDTLVTKPVHTSLFTQSQIRNGFVFFRNDNELQTKLVFMIALDAWLEVPGVLEFIALLRNAKNGGPDFLPI